MVEFVDFKGAKTCIFGIQGSGKTYFAQKEYRFFEKPIVFVVNDDDLEKWKYLPKLYIYHADRNNTVADFNKFIKKARDWALQGKVDCIIIDEADQFFQTNWNLNAPFLDLILNHRHMGKNGCALWFMTRRPQDIPTKIVEQSKFMIIFKLEGVNAIRRFSEINPLLPSMIERLDYQRHNFIFKELGKDPEFHKPL